MHYKKMLMNLNIVLGVMVVPEKLYAHSNINVVELTAEQAQKDLQNKRYTSVELTQAFLKQIDTYNPHYNAIITFNKNALQDAAAIDQRRAQGEKLGPLAGIPVVIKDTMDFSGFPTTAGWSVLSAHSGGIELIPEKDAPVIQRLKSSGAIILGKTNVPILSLSATNANNSWAGPTYNAVSSEYAPGGSSAGTSTAVAGNFAILGLGEETGGSIQNPAAAQALVSIKPTFALVPNTGVFPLATSTRDVVGPITKTVYDAALTLDILAGYTADDPKTKVSTQYIPNQGYTHLLNKNALKGKRIGLYGAGWRKNAPLSQETQTLYDREIKQLKDLGAIIVSDPFLNSDFSSIAKPIEIAGIGGYDSRGEDSIVYDLQQYLASLGSSSPIRSVEELKQVTQHDPFEDQELLAYLKVHPSFVKSLKNPTIKPDLSEFLKAKAQYINTLNQVMKKHQLDALVFPQMRSETPYLMSSEVIADTTVSEINIGGFPAVTVPAGYYKSGSAFSLIFISRLWDEANLLSYAYAYEQKTQHRKAPILMKNKQDISKLSAE